MMTDCFLYRTQLDLEPQSRWNESGNKTLVLTVSCQRVDTEGAGQCCIQDLSEQYSRTHPRTLRPIARFDPHRSRGTWCFNTQHCSTEFRVPELFRSESCIPKTSGHNVGLPALYRPSTAETCLVMSSNIEALGARVRRIVAPQHFCILHNLPLCTSKKLPSTCLSLPRPWRCMTPQGCAGNAVHDRGPQVSDYRLKAHCLGARPSPWRTARTRPKTAQPAMASCSSS